MSKVECKEQLQQTHKGITMNALVPITRTTNIITIDKNNTQSKFTLGITVLHYL